MDRRIVRAIGGGLALACLAWVAWRFIQGGVWQRVAASPHVAALVGRMLLAIPLYAVGLCALGVAWWCIQRALSATPSPALPTIFAIYASTQFAKYLPGNVGQYVGRHLLLRRHGFGHAALAAAALVEAGFLVLAALVLAAPGLHRLYPGMPAVSAMQALLAELIMMAAAIPMLAAVVKRHPRLHRLLPLQSPAWLGAVPPLHLAFFAVMAGTLMLLAHALGMETHAIWLLPSAAAASWIAGFLAIGAPGGLGVREAVFLVLLRGALPEADILLLAAAFRVTTFAGDALFFALGAALGRHRPMPIQTEQPS